MDRLTYETVKKLYEKKLNKLFKAQQQLVNIRSLVLSQNLIVAGGWFPSVMIANSIKYTVYNLVFHKLLTTANNKSILGKFYST